MKREKLYNLRDGRARVTIARQIGITPQMLGAIERGDRNPSLELAKKIADFYGSPVDDIFFNQNRNEVCPGDSSSTIAQEQTESA